MTRNQRRWLVAILLVGLAARLAWVFYATKEPLPLTSGDAYSYYEYGRQLAGGHDLRSYVTGSPTAYYPIGYPTILAGPFWIVEHTPIPDNLALTGTLLNVVFGMLSIWLVFVIARRLFNVQTALVAAGITAVFPNLVFYTASLQLETAFIFFLLAALAVIVTHDWSSGPPSRARLLAFGVVLGISACVRPFSLPMLAGVVLAIVVAGFGWRRAAAAVGWVMIPLVVLFTPWTVRNIVVMDSPVVFSTNMGDTLCIDRREGATGRFAWAMHEGCVDPRLGEVRRNSGNTEKALDFIREDPLRELKQMFVRARWMMTYDHDGLIANEWGGVNPFLGSRLRTVLTWIADWFFLAVTALAVVGLPRFFARDRRPIRLIVVVTLLSLFVIPMLLWGNDRFHMPFVPLLAISAAIPLARLRLHGSPRAPEVAREDRPEQRVPAPAAT